MTEPRSAPTTTKDVGRVPRLRRLVWWLDERFRIPGTSIRLGLDPILGLIPGLGDAAGALIGAAILATAVRERVPKPTLLRMVTNIGLDAAIGMIPLIGDVFDAGWKANRRNLDLLERHARVPLEAQRADRAVVAALFGLLILLCAVLLLMFILVARTTTQLLTGL